MNEHDAATSRFGAMSGCVRSTPVSMSATFTPWPRLSAYEPAVVALIARMSHWQAPSGSGPVVSGTPYSAAHVAFSAAGLGVTAARAGTRTGFEPFWRNHASWATPTTAPDRRSCDANARFAAVTVAIPSLFTLTTVPPARRTATRPTAGCALFRTTM